MDTQTIDNQKVHIDYLKSEMKAGYSDYRPEKWAVQKGYIPTCHYKQGESPANKSGVSLSTEGVDFVVLDNEHIAYRDNGDSGDAGEWIIGDPDEFVKFVIDDAEDWLAIWFEETAAE